MKQNKNCLEQNNSLQYSLELLRAAGVTVPPTVLLDLPFDEAQKALQEGRLDALMTFSAAENPLILECLKSKDLKIMSLKQAAFVERLTLLLIPLGVIILPLIGIAPWIYTWRNRSRYYPYYRKLRNLEKEILENKPVDKIPEYNARLEQIEEAVSHLHTSVAFYDELFILKGHVQNVRLKLEALAPPDSCAEPIGRG